MDIKKELEEYILSEEHNGALLLTGKWGCGKSYLVKSVANDFNKDKTCSISVISLFGVNTISMVHEMIKDHYLELNSGLLGNQARKVYRVLKKVSTESAKITATALPESIAASAISTGVSSAFSFNPLNFIAVKNTVGVGDKKRNFAIVFDDFERCDIAIKSLLGVINEYSENRKIKTILIADEDKITNAEYKEFKEKLVSRTIKLDPDHSQTIHQILEAYSSKDVNRDEEYSTFLLNNEACLRGAFLHSGYNNLRTFKACIFDFKRVYDAWKKSGVSMDDVETILYKFCAMEYEAKAGLYVKAPLIQFHLAVPGETDQQKDEARKRITDKYLPGTFDYITACLSSWIVEGCWEEDKFMEYIHSRYVPEEQSPEKRFVGYVFWDLNQEDIDQGMPPLVSRANQGEATVDELIALFSKVHALKHHGIPLPCEVDYNAIDCGLEMRKQRIRNGEIQPVTRRSFLEKHQLDSEAWPIYQKIEAMDDQLVAWENRRLFISFIKGDGKFSKYDFKGMYIDAFDDELLSLFVSAYQKADNGEKRELALILLGINFTDNTYSSLVDKEKTRENFNKLLVKLCPKHRTIKDQISGIITKHFEEQLKQKIVQLDMPEE